MVDDGLELPGEEDLPGPGALQLGPVLGQEVVGAAAAPVHDVLVLTLQY